MFYFWTHIFSTDSLDSLLLLGARFVGSPAASQDSSLQWKASKKVCSVVSADTKLESSCTCRVLQVLTCGESQFSRAYTDKPQMLSQKSSLIASQGAALNHFGHRWHVHMCISSHGFKNWIQYSDWQASFTLYCLALLRIAHLMRNLYHSPSPQSQNICLRMWVIFYCLCSSMSI